MKNKITKEGVNLNKVNEEIIKELTKQNIELQIENKEFRRLLWLKHGCDSNNLYGDDGELQCHECGVDFKRFSIEDIEVGMIKDPAHKQVMENMFKMAEEVRKERTNKAL